MSNKLEIKYDRYDIEAMRKRAGFTQHELVNALGISKVTYYRWLHDVGRIPICEYNRLLDLIETENEQ